VCLIWSWVGVGCLVGGVGGVVCGVGCYVVSLCSCVFVSVVIFFFSFVVVDVFVCEGRMFVLGVAYGFWIVWIFGC